MEIKTVNKDAEWYLSYIEEDQCKALIKCLLESRKQNLELLNKIIAETEQLEYAPEVLLNSIRTLIEQMETITIQEGFFVWVDNLQLNNKEI